MQKKPLFKGVADMTRAERVAHLERSAQRYKELYSSKPHYKGWTDEDWWRMATQAINMSAP